MRLATRCFRLLAVTALAVSAAGCTGSNLLPTGNSSLGVSFEVVGSDLTFDKYDCVNFLLASMSVRPLDGVCVAPATNAGEPCLNGTDCTGGPCEGSSASSVITNSIGLVSADPENPTNPANVLGNSCELSKRCNGTGDICEDVSDCAMGQVCSLPFGNSSNADPFVPPNPITVSEGLYEVDIFTIGFLMFSDAPPENLNCASPVDYADAYGDGLRFRVPADAPKELVFRLDLDQLEDALAMGCLTFTAKAVPDVLECLTCDGAP